MCEHPWNTVRRRVMVRSRAKVRVRWPLGMVAVAVKVGVRVNGLPQ